MVCSQLNLIFPTFSTQVQKIIKPCAFDNKPRSPSLKQTTLMASTSTQSQSLQIFIINKLNFPSLPQHKPIFNNTNFKFSFSFPLNKSLLRVESSSTAKYNEVVVDEEMDKIRRLQNGSDVRGVALEGEKGRTVDLTPPAVEAVAESFGEWVVGRLKEQENGGKVENVKVSLGRDPRISGASLSVAVFAGLARAGCLVFDMGLATTPACFMSTLLPPFAYDASIMVFNNILVFSLLEIFSISDGY